SFLICTRVLFFFLLIRLPPRFTLFPYTTLFRSLDVLAGADVLRGASGTLGEPVEQVRIHVVADAERKDAELAAVLLGARGDLFGVRLAGAGLAVGEEYDHAQRLLGGCLGKRFSERARDVRPAFRLETANPGFSVAASICR